MKKVTSLLIVTILLSGCSVRSFTDTTAIENHEHHALNILDPGDCNHERVIRFDEVKPTYLKPGHIAFYYCMDCKKSYYDYRLENEIPNSNYAVTDKRDGRYVAPLTKPLSIISNNVRAYLDATSEEEIINALKNAEASNDQVENLIVWNEGVAPFVIETSSSRSFDEIKTYNSSIGVFKPERILIPGETVYYRIKDSTGKYVYDDLSFRANDNYSLRPLYVEGMNNMRDLGGWKLENGKTIQYGKLYRGAYLDNITEKGKDTLLNTLGVKTEIDVRTDGYQSLFDNRITYHQYGIWQYTRIIPDFAMWDSTSSALHSFDEGSPASIKNIFETLANPNNYPVYYHCTAGADRTGTISYLIGGLLGMSYEDLTKDFELTSFSIQGPRWRDSLNEDETAFTGSGVYNTIGNFIAWGKLQELMMARYGKEDNKLSTAIENYLKTICEISDETIASVKANLVSNN